MPDYGSLQTDNTPNISVPDTHDTNALQVRRFTDRIIEIAQSKTHDKISQDHMLHNYFQKIREQNPWWFHSNLRSAKLDDRNPHILKVTVATNTVVAKNIYSNQQDKL